MHKEFTTKLPSKARIKNITGRTMDYIFQYPTLYQSTKPVYSERMIDTPAATGIAIYSAALIMVANKKIDDTPLFDDLFDRIESVIAKQSSREMKTAFLESATTACGQVIDIIKDTDVQAQAFHALERLSLLPESESICLVINEDQYKKAQQNYEHSKAEPHGKNRQIPA